jgi:hydroxyacylglutathione hydrolase
VLFERFEDHGLAHYSYALGCEAAAAIAIVDPRRDIDVYLEFATIRHVRITHVLETHIHADYASGARELAQRTGAELCLSAYDADEMYEVSFPHLKLRDGDDISIGRARIEALHTPGHTPEHLAFLVYDTARSAEVPQLLLSGDFVLVGSVGRPDLIGDEAKHALAGRLFDSVQKIARLPDGLEVHPAHGSGSLCSTGVSSRPMSTLGFERIANPYLDASLTRAAFIERLLGKLPPFPPYYRRMKLVNASGPAPLNGLPGLGALSPADVHERLAAGHIVIDLRDQIGFGGGHIPGAFGIGAGTKLSMWSPWVVPYDTPIILVTSDPKLVPDAVRSLVRVGLDEVRGYLSGGMKDWAEAGYPVSMTRSESPVDLADLLAREPSRHVIDVRTVDEWESGHISGATHIMAGDLPALAPGLAGSHAPLAVICGKGYRSTVAVSVLERAGARDVINVIGGMTAWEHAGLPMSTD